MTLGFAAVPAGPPFHYCFLVITCHGGRLKSSKNQKDSIKQLLMNQQLRISRYSCGLWLDFYKARSTLEKIGHNEYRYMPFTSLATIPRSKRRASKKSFFRETEARFSFTQVCKHEFMSQLVLSNILKAMTLNQYTFYMSSVIGAQ